MDNLLYISTSGAKENMNALAVRANNLANAKTVGFKADLEQARAMQAFGEGLPTRVFSMTESPRADFRPGPIMTTGRKLDVAIKEKGFFTVYDSNNREAMTRNGALKIRNDGALINDRGQVLVGLEGPIVLPVPVQDFQISPQGQITFRPRGAAPTELAVAGQLKLQNPPIENLMKMEDGMFRLKDPLLTSVPPEAVEFNDIQLEFGALEGSNVNPVNEMVAMISLQRQFEMQVKMIKTAEEVETSGAQLMRS